MTTTTITMWNDRLSFGQAFGRTFGIVLGHLDVFCALGLCQWLPLLPVVALFMSSAATTDNDAPSGSGNHTNHTDTTFLATFVTTLGNNTNNTTNNDNDDGDMIDSPGAIVLYVVCFVTYVFVSLVVTGALVHATAHIEAAAFFPGEAAVTNLSLSIGTAMRRGWQRACPLLGAMLLLGLVLGVLQQVLIFAVSLVFVLSGIGNISFLQTLVTMIVGIVAVVVLAWAMAGSVCVSPAVVLGRRAVVPSIRQSFALAKGQQWYILCLHVCTTLVEFLFLLALWTVLGDFTLMTLLGADFTLQAVLLLGGTMSTVFGLLRPAFSLVLNTVLYINLRACHDEYTPDDLMQDLSMAEDRTLAVASHEQEQQPDDNNENELETPLLENAQLMEDQTASNETSEVV